MHHSFMTFDSSVKTSLIPLANGLDHFTFASVFDTSAFLKRKVIKKIEN